MLRNGPRRWFGECAVSRSSKALNRHTTGNRVHGVGVIRERNHDAYHADEKMPSGTECRQCGAVVKRGAWRWELPAKGRDGSRAASMSAAPRLTENPSFAGVAGLCPACERIQGHDAAGVLIIDPSVMKGRSPQLHATMMRIVGEEIQSHPMERILSIEDQADGSCLVQTTGLHLLRRLGHGLASAFAAHLHTHYMEAEYKATMRLSA